MKYAPVQSCAYRRTTHAGEGVLEHWSDPSVGDPAFYKECLAPLVEKLDDYAARVVPGMTDAGLVRQFNQA